MREGLKLGADDYLVKPFSIPELIATVNMRLRRRKELTKANYGARPETNALNEGQKAAPTRQADFEAKFGEALARGKADRVSVALFMIQIIGPERIRRTLGGATIASVMA